MIYEDDVVKFIELANQFGLRMLLVGGGAVNFHGYQRHSADVDFWIDLGSVNLQILLKVLQNMKFDLEELPQEVLNGDQNISIKISPHQTLELITRFNPNKSFEEAWEVSIETHIKGHAIARYRVLGIDDLISSKIKAGRPKDLMDIVELQRLNK